MRILIVSTIRHNPGDSFIRLGQEWLFDRVVANAEFSVIHKHDPRTLFGDFERHESSPHRLVAPLLYRIHRRRTEGPDLLADADLVVFAGTPFIWRQNTSLFPSTSANAEWVKPTWGRLFDEFPEKPVINLAAGTSLNAGQEAADILRDPPLVAFLRNATTRADLTTARDKLTAQVLANVGHHVPMMPCTSLWSAQGAGLTAQPPEYIAVNVMRHAVHSARGKHTDSRRWRKAISAVVSALAIRHPIAFVCHSRDEYQLAREWFPDYEAIFSWDERKLLAAYGSALYTVSNRVHGAAGAASFHRPALCIGGDSRMALLHEFGLPTISAEATPEEVLHKCDDLEANYDRYCSGLRSLSETAEVEYLKLLTEVISR